MSGISVSYSLANGWIGLPFFAGALPDKVTAVVWVSNALVAGVSVNEITSTVEAESVGVSVDVDSAMATIETNKINAEVT